MVTRHNFEAASDRIRREHAKSPQNSPSKAKPPAMADFPSSCPKLAAIIVNDSGTDCSLCGQGTDPTAPSHQVILSSDESKSGKPACGAKFFVIVEHHYGVNALAKKIQALRPDLRFIYIWAKPEPTSG